MIKKAAIREFLDRKRRSLSLYKKLTDQEIEERMLALPVRPPIWRKLHRRQKIGLLLGARYQRTGMFLRTGHGKTLLAIALIKYFKKLLNFESNKCVLVLVPNKGNKEEWGFEIEKHSPKTKYCVLAGSTACKWQQFDDNQDCLIFIETYAGFSRMVCEIKKNKKGQDKLIPDKALVKKLCQRVVGLINDESTFVGNKGTIPWRVCRKLSQDAAEFVFELTGTPFGRDPILLWAQSYILDFGKNLGETLELFRAAFYRKQPDFWGGHKYTFRPRMSKALNAILNHNTISFPKDSKELPACIKIEKEFRLPEEARTYYQKARKMLHEAGGNPKKIQELFIRMRQISSGYLGYTDDDQKGQFFFAPNKKIELLSGLVQPLIGMDKLLIYHEFNPTGDMICKAMEELKLTFMTINGRTKDAKHVLDSFRKSDNTQGLVLNSAGGFGLNLQCARYCFFVESPISPIMREQVESRIIRPYSEHKTCYLYDLIAKGTVDRTIIQFHKEGRDLWAEIIDGKTKL